jgi:sialate O-acetylesterase
LDSANTPVRYAYNSTEEIAAASLFTPWVRLFKVRHSQSPTPLTNLDAPPALPWSPASPATVSGFSATCWFHGREIALALGPSVPLALVESAWGGTSIQPWSDPGVTAACGDFPSYPGGWPTATSSLFNAMTFPFAGMKFSGFVWYQGEELPSPIHHYPPTPLIIHPTLFTPPSYIFLSLFLSFSTKVNRTV